MPKENPAEPAGFSLSASLICLQAAEGAGDQAFSVSVDEKNIAWLTAERT